MKLEFTEYFRSILARQNLTSRLVFLIAALAPLPGVAGDVLHGHGLLWRVEKAGNEPSYLFGTVHSEDQRVLDLPVLVRDRLDAAVALVIEAQVDSVNDLQSMQAMVFTDGTRLSDVLETSLYERTVAAMQSNGYPQLVVDLMKPWAISVVLSIPSPKTGTFLDIYLMNEARRQGKSVGGLETVAEQLEAMNGFSVTEQAAILEATLDHLAELEGLHERLIRAYLDRDLEKLVRISEETMGLTSKAISEKFNRNLLVERNRRMVQRMETYLDRGNAFIAVGALHLPDQTGILALLEKKGYRISAIY